MVKTRKKCPAGLRDIAEMWRDEKMMASSDQWEKAQQEIHSILERGDIAHYDIALREFNRIYNSPRKTRVRKS